MDGSGAGRASDAPTPVRIRRVEAVVNAASGSVGPGAADALERILAEHGYAFRIANAEPKDIAAAVHVAVDSAPDLIVVLAGDGTASLAARLAGATGPLLAPLPGGTMNMLPHALYGPVNWRNALDLALSVGESRPVSGGEVDGRRFYVAAILGTPALWGEAREAMRAKRVRLAWLRARRAIWCRAG
jgi:diacylglycerol kinase family enzyme